MRSVELMVPDPWFPESVRLLNENPGLDVGLHLVVTSEWNDRKWRPLSCCRSLVDKDTVTKVFSSKEVMDAAKASGIRLVSYKNLSDK
jgi:predicted glycoside hydrolase/deacetylase ChbG (UPF0249 family)